MSWQSDGIIMLRIMLNDNCDDPQYSDSSLEQLLVVAAHYVITDVSLSVDYEVSISDMTITPDPTDDPRDEVFINFMVLKAACLADQGNFRLKAALEGIKAVLGPAALSVGGNLRGYLTILEQGPCKAYADMKKDFAFGNTTVKAIFSPFVGNRFDPLNLRIGRDGR